MLAIIGLGNPGDEYKDTRHNAGWKCIDSIAEDLSANYWKNECGAQVAHCKSSLYDDEILLVKPMSFMNLSGGPVKNICDKYKVPKDELIVVHDDMDILPGNIRLKFGGSSAGHNGLKSISQKLQTDDYLRVRIGIGRSPGNKPYNNYVLGVPKGKDLDSFTKSCDIAKDAVLYLFNHSLDQAQQFFNSKNSDR